MRPQFVQGHFEELRNHAVAGRHALNEGFVEGFSVQTVSLSKAGQISTELDPQLGLDPFGMPILTGASRHRSLFPLLWPCLLLAYELLIRYQRKLLIQRIFEISQKKLLIFLRLKSEIFSNQRVTPK